MFSNVHIVINLADLFRCLIGLTVIGGALGLVVYKEVAEAKEKRARDLRNARPKD
jgi:hypothetical protein